MSCHVSLTLVSLGYQFQVLSPEEVCELLAMVLPSVGPQQACRSISFLLSLFLPYSTRVIYIGTVNFTLVCTPYSTHTENQDRAKFSRGRHGGTSTYVMYTAKIAISPTLVETTTFPVETNKSKGRFEQLLMSRVQICSYFQKKVETF